MGMVANRCKRKWARWNGGLRSLLQLLLIRKTRPASYGWAVRSYFRGASLAPASLPVGPPLSTARNLADSRPFRGN